MPEKLRKRIRRPNNTYYVYGLLRETGEPFYVGYGRGDRWNDHEREARYTLGSNPRKIRIIRSMLASGLAEIPKVKFVEGLSRNEAADFEKALVAAIGRWPNGPLVNIIPGGKAPPVQDGPRSPEHRAKIAAAHRGMKATAEARANMSAAHRGKSLPLEQRAKIAAAGRGRSEEMRAKVAAALRAYLQSLSLEERRTRMLAAQLVRNNGLPRKPHSAETRAKMSAAQRGRPGHKPSEETRAKMSAAHRGKKMLKETRAKMSIAQRRRRGTI